MKELISVLNSYKKPLVSVFFLLPLLFLFYYLYSHRSNQIDNSSSVVLTNAYQIPNDNDKLVIIAEISGQVTNPGTYEMRQGDRVVDVIKKAGGFTERCDKQYIDQFLNQAALISDGQKIYVPEVHDSSNPVSASNSLININTASASELDSLPGIGEVRSQDIINSRPYSRIDDLLSKKVISQSVFEDIKDAITI